MQPHTIAVHRAADRALKSSSDMTAFHAVSRRDQQQFMASGSPRVLHVDIPASGKIGAWRRERLLFRSALRRVSQHLRDAAGGQRVIARPNRRRTHVERVPVAGGVRHDARFTVDQLFVHVARGDPHARRIPLDDHGGKRTGARGSVHHCPDAGHLGDGVADFLEV